MSAVSARLPPAMAPEMAVIFGSMRSRFFSTSMAKTLRMRRQPDMAFSAFDTS